MLAHPKGALGVQISNRWYLATRRPLTTLPLQSSSSSSSGTKMSCSSSSAAKFLLIWVPTYKKGSTTRAILKRPKGVCLHITTETAALDHVTQRYTSKDRWWAAGTNHLSGPSTSKHLHRHHGQLPSSTHLLRFGQNSAGGRAHGPGRCHGPPGPGRAGCKQGGVSELRQSGQNTERRSRHVDNVRFFLVVFARVCFFLTQQRCGTRVMVLVSTAPPSVTADSLHAGRSRSKTKYVSSRCSLFLETL